MPDMQHIRQNLARIRESIASACVRAGRDPSEITLVAVTKTVDPAVIEMGIELGIADLGENRPQEILRKKELIKADVRWHLIGQLQRNKVKGMVDAAWLIHSLDRLSLAEEIEKRAGERGITQPVLIEVNISGEDAKSGMKPDMVLPFVEAMAAYPHLKVMGLMTMAPFYDDPEMTRPVFRQAKILYDSIVDKRWPHVDMRWLSMGMTNDYTVAVEEGATMVRIGRALFGERVI